jgi:hypothetical protein
MIVENNKILMVKYTQKKEYCEVSTSHSIYSESDTFPSETLSNIIDQMPKLTAQERKDNRLHIFPMNNSRKWSQP